MPLSFSCASLGIGVGFFDSIWVRSSLISARESLLAARPLSVPQKESRSMDLRSSVLFSSAVSA